MIPQIFAKKLLDWHKNNNRAMPWAESKDPYKIWISEIILQQTRVAQGWNYYLRFLEKFPDIFALYHADESEVFSQWEGLGYYSRAKNLIKTSKIIVENFNGIFPDTYEGLLKLPGIGPYTASAIAGFVYNLPYPVLDGNVTRLVARLKGISGPIQDTTTLKEIKTFTIEAILTSTPSLFNQAIMNFGAMVCKPISPLCQECTFQKYCVSYQKQVVDQIPAKKPKIIRLNRYFHYFLFVDVQHKTTFVSKRKNKDIWQNLYEFPLIETYETGILSKPMIQSVLQQNGWLTPDFSNVEYRQQSQLLTHQKVNFCFYKLTCNFSLLQYPKDFLNLSIQNVSLLPMPIQLKKILDWVKI